MAVRVLVKQARLRAVYDQNGLECRSPAVLQVTLTTWRPPRLYASKLADFSSWLVKLRSWSTEHCWIPSVRPWASFRLSTLSTQLQVLLLSVVASLSASRTCSPIVWTPCWTSRRRRRLHGAEFTNESYQSASERSVVTVVRTPQLYRLTRRLGPAATRRPVLSSVMPRRLYPIKEFGEVSTTSSSYSSELHTTASSWRLVRQPRIGLSFIDDEIAQTEPHHDFQVTIRLRLSR